jgi:hypothetical protein
VNPSTTATVETLTAQVRVLMVGSRQVTLSIFDQLDSCHPDLITPFGRVSPRNERPKQVTVVGRSPGGELCRSSIGIPSRNRATGGVWGWHWSNHGGTAVNEKEQERMADRYAEWINLPLIVLAGLR